MFETIFTASGHKSFYQHAFRLVSLKKGLKKKNLCKNSAGGLYQCAGEGLLDKIGFALINVIYQ